MPTKNYYKEFIVYKFRSVLSLRRRVNDLKRCCNNIYV